ncbi:hypothetical protein ES332_D08G240900v1 [Gossypium tomentosum]|uniref:HIT-type domain-containing protein n=1 Tax=Gossypium tomentosum TaxID=34277 RepID=A0A5D2JY01_GOSTO|nr:hypothetical protein ES332_D08G240900v1 [Gossypium tomentosum]
MGGPSRQCQVCNQTQSKYKCPSCLVPYCSLACFKTHKETPCEKLESVKEKSGTPSVNLGSIDNAVTTCVKPESTNDAVPPSVEPKSSEGRPTSSDDIREALKDEHLQKLISDINSSPDALNELDKAMGLDVFRIFSDKILSAINQ